MSRNPNPPTTTTVCGLAVGSVLGFCTSIFTVLATSSYVKDPMQQGAILLTGTILGGLIGYLFHQCRETNTPIPEDQVYVDLAIRGNTP